MIDPNTHLVIVSNAASGGAAAGGLVTIALTSADIPAIIAGLVILLPIITAQIITIMNARATRKEVAEIKAQSVETLAKTKVIEGHVNSEKTAAEGRERVLQSENKLLRETLAENNKTAALLAQSVATVATQSPAPQDVKVVNTPADPVVNKPTKEASTPPE